MYTREYSLWKCLCVLYPRCDIFSCVINDISLCIWWYFAQEYIYVAKQCQPVLKLMTKENVNQANACRFDKNSSTLCPLCGVCSEDEEHFLWDCNGLSSSRESLLSEIKSVLGQLSEDFMQLDTRSRTLCLFGGNGYLLETQRQMALLKAILVPIHQMYATRCTLL